MIDERIEEEETGVENAVCLVAVGVDSTFFNYLKKTNEVFFLN